MASFVAVVLMALMLSGPFASGLKCNEGFNMSLNGIPLYFWNERECYGNSKCIKQDLSYSTSITGDTLNADLRYGACMSNSYVNYLDCDNLFGVESKFDPANLLNMIPEFEQSFANAIENFSRNTSASLKLLLSDGKGTKAFVDGVFRFYENLGFDFSKATPLKPSLVRMLSAAIDGNLQTASLAYSEFLLALGSLDTANLQFSKAIRLFFSNLGADPSIFEHVTVRFYVDKAPGLLRSFFPDSWQRDLWYDVAIKFMGDINPFNWTKSTEDMVATFKTSYSHLLPSDVTQYIYPILDALPDLTNGSLTNPQYVGEWSIELLKKFSEVDSSSKKFSDSLISFISQMTFSPLQEEYKDTLTWIPGLFYKMFPGNKTIIEEVYSKMGDGFASSNFQNVSSTAPETKLSLMIKNVIKAVGSEQAFRTSPIYNMFVVNFSKMFYDLMAVDTVDYTNYIDGFATIVDTEFKSWPKINVGKLISKLITGMGGIVPKELTPLLDNMQPVLTIAMEQPFSANKLVLSFQSITNSYQMSFPNSPFPDIVYQYISIIYNMVTLDLIKEPLLSTQMLNKMNLELMYNGIDLQFAIIKSLNFTNDDLYKMATKSWPDFDLYIRIMKAMDSEDVNKMIKDVLRYMGEPPYTTEGFVLAIKPAFQRITKSIGSYLGEVRQLVAPDSCNFLACDTDLCNGVSDVAVTRELTTTPADDDATTLEIIVDTTADIDTDIEITTNVVDTTADIDTDIETATKVDETTTDIDTSIETAAEEWSTHSTTSTASIDTTIHVTEATATDEQMDTTVEESSDTGVMPVDPAYWTTAAHYSFDDTTSLIGKTTTADNVVEPAPTTTTKAVSPATTKENSIDMTPKVEFTTEEVTTEGDNGDETTTDEGDIGDPFETTTDEGDIDDPFKTTTEEMIDEKNGDLTTRLLLIQSDSTTRAVIINGNAVTAPVQAVENTEHNINIGGSVPEPKTPQQDGAVDSNNATEPNKTPIPAIQHNEQSTAVQETTSDARKSTCFNILHIFSAWLTIYILYR